MKRFTPILFLLLYLVSTQAQVTVTQSDIEAHIAVGNTITSYSDTLGGNVNIGAPGQSSWDFSGHPFQLQFDATSIDPGTSPAAGTFGSATHVTYSNPTFAGTTSETWVHLNVGGGGYSDLGTYSTVNAFGFLTTTTIDINPAEVITQLPLTYQATWNSTGTRQVDVVISGLPTGQSYNVDYNITRTVDAYGSLTMPDGSVENVLRVKIISEITTNVTGTPITSNSLGFMWISPSGASVSVNAVDPNAADNGTIEAADVTWSYGNGTSTGVDQVEELANSFSLRQNYPNPFNPSTTIQYSIPKASHVSLKVYDVLGNEVAELVNENLSAGVYNVDFNGSDLSSGIYFYTLFADNFTSTKKLMLIK